MLLAEAVKPRYCNHPTVVKSDGPDVCDLAALANFAPDPEQEEGLNILFAYDPVSGKSLVFEYCDVCCRQNLKTGLFKQAALGWLYITEVRYVVWSAHEFDTAKQAHLDMAELITNTPSLSRLLKPNGIHFGAADRSINLKTGQRLVFKARTATGGRGLSAQKVVLDESFALMPEHMGALMPTLSVQPDPQIVYGSSAGLDKSAVLRSIRDRGRAGTSPRLSYREWIGEIPCADPVCDHRYGMVQGCAMDNLENYAMANPLLGRTRANGTGLTVEYVRAEREAMPPEEFGRERLGWWDDPLDELQPINVDEWLALGAEGAPNGVPDFFIDCSPNLRSAAIAGAALWHGKPHVSLADYQSGTDWVVSRALELKSSYPGSKWMFEATGPASALAEQLAEAGIRVERPFTSTEMARGCSHLQKLVADKAMSHSGDRMLGSALRNAVRRDVGDPGLWAWGRKKSSGDISPIVAATGALWLLETTRRTITPAIY